MVWRGLLLFRSQLSLCGAAERNGEGTLLQVPPAGSHVPRPRDCHAPRPPTHASASPPPLPASAHFPLQVIAGSDKGVVGTIVDVNTKRGEVLVEGVNIKVRMALLPSFLLLPSSVLLVLQAASFYSACSPVRRVCLCCVVQGIAGGGCRNQRGVAVCPVEWHERGGSHFRRRLWSCSCLPACLPVDNLPRTPPAAPQTKHVKPVAQGEAGQIVKKEFPVHHSNVAVYSTAQQTHSRVGFK